MHKAFGGEGRNHPSKWLANKRTQPLINLLRARSENSKHALLVIRGHEGGTWACLHLAVAYAGHLNPEFWLWMTETFLASDSDSPVPSSGKLDPPSQMERVFRFALSESIAPLVRKIDSLAKQNIALQTKLDGLQAANIQQGAVAAPPAQERPARASAKTRRLHLSAIVAARAGACPCCRRQAVAATTPPQWKKGVRVARFDRNAPGAGAEDTWPVCPACYKQHAKSGFSSKRRRAFVRYQADLANHLAERAG